MLILSRKKNEQIVISDDITITVLDVEGEKVKIGIDAPKDIKVFRKELIEEVKSTNTESTSSTVASLKELQEKIFTKKI